ncbi:hypothetical protein IC007_0775 [Sulfuracidifex tepidarius]|uniref:Uncharacterized protein n=1 Tax=Sulfuracidifex tepidarius TaxID=1294262 RepID=A0A510E2E1_9CREN|nr:hypothetical protein IC007_0775 [Sulfuracidifex tepidarius]
MIDEEKNKSSIKRRDYFLLYLPSSSFLYLCYFFLLDNFMYIRENMIESDYFSYTLPQAFG